MPKWFLEKNSAEAPRSIPRPRRSQVREARSSATAPSCVSAPRRPPPPVPAGATLREAPTPSASPEGITGKGSQWASAPNTGVLRKLQCNPGLHAPTGSETAGLLGREGPHWVHWLQAPATQAGTAAAAQPPAGQVLRGNPRAACEGRVPGPARQQSFLR